MRAFTQNQTPSIQEQKILNHFSYQFHFVLPPSGNIRVYNLAE